MEKFEGKEKGGIWREMIFFVWITILGNEGFGWEGNGGTNVIKY